MRRTGLSFLLLLLVALAGCEGKSTQAAHLAARGLEQAREQHLDKAMELFDGALALDPHNLKALYNGGLAHLFLRQGTEAADRFLVYVELRPEDPLGHFNLSRARALEHRGEDALASLRRAVELGFDDHAELSGGGFESLEDDLRFIQIEALVAQRAGIQVEADRAQGAGAYGGQQLRPMVLPGQPGRSCRRVAPAPAGSDDGAPVETAQVEAFDCEE